ncbi:type III-A CRISPR-associated RAMP protein Csm4 [Nostoc sp. 'Peltigera membranacea cyanobiont' N6]|uniref:type III-A CRISPR-associated RAMP protein Csm4 n=1 Tax=Nostoc sp. 'Peltigera membranacea cyanobiont' N6 TaxID=1261031 RepID=UPI000CF35A23|nr:type III-A CRISPR-associated RAMP protein Csm4 [Nostoc sp. 'Peltigera membranacea cyanobiont' N6]AVH61970.1 CRISPR-associated RAMP protein Csm4 [Nostoc sp. 'Peltigera membranacea cyanobiont' N6]
MGKWQLVKLNFGRSSVHFGELGIGMEESKERVRSDTLFSAWVSNYARLFGKESVEELLEKFRQPKPPMRISSTFIYHEPKNKTSTKNDTIFYLPKPLKFPPNYQQDDDLKFFKTYKSLNYLPLDVWHIWYQSEGFKQGEDDKELTDKTNGNATGKLKQAGTFDYGEAFKHHKLPKVAIDRTTRATNFYHTGYVQFDWEQNGSSIKSLSGLYFLVYFEDNNEQLIAELKAALDLLGEQGIGGERSSGAGLFQADWLELKDASPLWENVVKPLDDNAYHCLISLFWDDDESILKRLIIDNSHSNYEVQERGGWFSDGNIRRQMVRMFVEGSVFPIEPQGKLANVTPSELINEDGSYKTHAIYRSGIALSLPIKVQI